MAIRQGKTAAGIAGTGFWIGNNSGTAQFWIGNLTKYVYWNGGALVARQLEVRNSADDVILTSGGEFDGTYIADASVGTLAIENNAVTIPLSIQYGAMSSYTTNGVETVVSSTSLTADFGTSAPTKVIFIAMVDLQSSATGSDYAACQFRLRYNTTNSTTIGTSTIVEAVQVNDRKGAAPHLSLSNTLDGWTGARYFFLTIEVAGEGTSATGWWKASDANIILLGSRK